MCLCIRQASAVLRERHQVYPGATAEQGRGRDETVLSDTHAKE